MSTCPPPAARAGLLPGIGTSAEASRRNSPAALNANYRQRQDSYSSSGQELQVEIQNDVHVVTPPDDVA
jgi:outer membrane protein TolC